MTPEGKIKAKINKALKTIDPIFKYMPVPTGFGRATLDYLICTGGTFVAIEAKKDASAELTPRQMMTINELLTAGAVVCVVYDDESLRSMLADISGAPRLLRRDPIPVHEHNVAWTVRANLAKSVYTNINSVCP